MDHYGEHLIPIRKNAKIMGTLALIWIMLLLVAAISFILLTNLLLCLIITGVAIYGCVYFTKMLNVEYEYMVTNGDFDVDIITSKSNRKRIISFNCKDIYSIEPYNKEAFNNAQFDKKSVYCNANDDDVYTVCLKHKGIGKVCLVMQLPKKVQEAMLPYLDKLIAREAFNK